MSNGRLSVVVRHLRKLADPPGGEPADGELLERCARRQDPDALDALVRRHGPLVLNVCRRVLGNSSDADDVFQATFLVFVRRARSLSPRGSLAAWLHAVACHLALRSRASARRRQHLERQAPLRNPPDPLAEVSGRELCALLDEELQRLPERYRAPLLLCCLEGRSRDEAAAELGWTASAVKGRLERGRELLRARLARRGLGLPAVLLAATAARAALPPALAQATRAVAAGAGVLAAGAPAARLADGLLQSSAAVRFGVVAALVLFAAVLSIGAALLAGRGPVVDPPPVIEARPGREAKPPLLLPQVAGHEPKGAAKLVTAVPVRLGPERFREGDELHGLAYSPDGKLLICANAQQPAVRLWDTATGKVVRSLDGHPSGVSGVAYSPDGRTVATASWDQIWLWDAVTGKELRRLLGHGHMTTVVAFAPDGKTLASGSYDKTARLWDVATGKQLHLLKGTRGTIHAVAFSPDGKTVAAGGDEDRLQLWEIATGNGLPTPPLVPGPTWSIAFARDGKTLAVGGRDRLLQCCDPVAGRMLFQHRYDDAAVHPQMSVAFSADGKTLACACSDGMVRLWDVRAGQEARRFDAGQGELHTVLFSPDGKTLTTGGTGSVRLWDFATGKELFPDEGHHGKIEALAFSPDGKLLASGGKDRTVCLWNVATGKELRRLHGHDDFIGALAFRPDGRTLVYGGGRAYALQVAWLRAKRRGWSTPYSCLLATPSE